MIQTPELKLVILREKLLLPCNGGLVKSASLNDLRSVNITALSEELQCTLKLAELKTFCVLA